MTICGIFQTFAVRHLMQNSEYQGLCVRVDRCASSTDMTDKRLLGVGPCHGGDQSQKGVASLLAMIPAGCDTATAGSAESLVRWNVYIN